MLEELGRNLRELGERFYVGDVAVVDEFLQLYCIARGQRAIIAKALESAKPSGYVDCGECPHISTGCKGKCGKAGTA